MITMPVRPEEAWPENILDQMSRDELVESRSAYLPTPEEILEACEEIQADWTDEERQARREFSPWQQLRAIVCECGQTTFGRNSARRFCDDCSRERKRRCNARKEVTR